MMPPELTPDEFERLDPRRRFELLRQATPEQRVRLEYSGDEGEFGDELAGPAIDPEFAAQMRREMGIER